MVDSPGGDITGISDFTKLIQSSKKQVSVFVTGYAASAAYWISSGAHHIAGADSSLEGSIGVVSTYRDMSKRLEKMGVEDIEIVSSQSPDKRPDLHSDEGRAVVQKVADDLADVFIDTVAANRGVSRSKVINDFGRGSVLVGENALRAGMIDDILSFDEFMSIKAQERGGRSEIRTLIFKKVNFSTAESAQKWAKEHKFKSSPVVEKEETWHITQKTGDYVRTRTGKPLSPGVTPIFGIRRRQNVGVVQKKGTTEGFEAFDDVVIETKPLKSYKAVAQVQSLPDSTPVKTQPANAGERKAAMNLAEFIAENPAAKAELEAVKAEAHKAGQAELRAQFEKIAVYLQSESYPKQVKALATRVIEGKASFDALEGAAIAIDAIRAEQESQVAQEESAKQPEPQDIHMPQGDMSIEGEFKSAADIEEWQKRMKSGNPNVEVA